MRTSGEAGESCVERYEQDVCANNAMAVTLCCPTAGCGKPHVRWCGRGDGLVPSPPPDQKNVVENGAVVMASCGGAKTIAVMDRSHRSAF